MDNISKNEVIDLLKQGFKSNIIEFEFGIPSELMQEYIKEYNKEINENLNISEEIKEIENMTDIRKIRNSMKKIIEQLNSTELTLNEYIIMYEDAENLKRPNFKNKEEYRYYYDYLKSLKNLLQTKVYNKIDILVKSTDDIEKLKELKKIILKYYKNYISLTYLRDKVDKKITDVQQKKNIEQLYIVTPEILNIIEKIANGTMNYEEAINIIEQEAKKEVEKNSNKKFGALTLEQEKERIINKIFRNLPYKSNEYQIKDIKTTYELLMKLKNQESEAISTIVKYYINQKEYKMAKLICSKAPRTKDYAEPHYIRFLENEIKKAENGIDNNVNKCKDK